MLRKSATKCGLGWFSERKIRNWVRIWSILQKGNPQLRRGLGILRKTFIKLHLGILTQRLRKLGLPWIPWLNSIKGGQVDGCPRRVTGKGLPDSILQIFYKILIPS